MNSCGNIYLLYFELNNLNLYIWLFFFHDRLVTSTRHCFLQSFRFYFSLGAVSRIFLISTDVRWHFNPWVLVWNLANKSNHVVFRLIAPNQSLDQCCHLYSEKKTKLRSPRWKHHVLFVDLWLTKDGSIQVLAQFSQACLVQVCASFPPFEPVSICCRSRDDPSVSLRCMKHCHPNNLACNLEPVHLITYTCLSLPTFRDLTQPEGERRHTRTVRWRFHLGKTKAQTSPHRYHLPANKHSIQNLNSAPRHRHLLRDPLCRCPVLLWGSKASSPGDDHR